MRKAALRDTRREPRARLWWPQVLLPIGQVMVEMSRFSNEPIVFLGHPIAMVNSTTRRA